MISEAVARNNDFGNAQHTGLVIKISSAWQFQVKIFVP